MNRRQLFAMFAGIVVAPLVGWRGEPWAAYTHWFRYPDSTDWITASLNMSTSGRKTIRYDDLVKMCCQLSDPRPAQRRLEGLQRGLGKVREHD